MCCKNKIVVNLLVYILVILILMFCAIQIESALNLRGNFLGGQPYPIEANIKHFPSPLPARQEPYSFLLLSVYFGLQQPTAHC